MKNSSKVLTIKTSNLTLNKSNIMRFFNIKHLTLLLTLTLFVACSDDDDATLPPQADIPTVVTVTNAGLYPGKIDFHFQKNKFILGSMVKSEVGLVGLNGDYETFITDSNLALVTGIYADVDRNRLVVASGDLGISLNSVANGDVSYVGIYNLETGAKIEGVDLKPFFPSAASFANDIAVDAAGNIYVTDSFLPVIYKIDGSTYEASVFIDGGQDFEVLPVGPGFGLNGIVYKNGYLLVNKTDDGSIFKVPVANPSAYYRVNAPAFVGADGFEFTKDGDLILVDNGIGPMPGTLLLSSNDDWDTISLVSTFSVAGEKSPTSVALASNGEVYVITSYLGKALSGDLTQDSFDFIRAIH